MKKFTVACIAFAAVSAFAGTAAAEGGKLGVDGAVVIPTGDWGDAAGIGFGAMLAGRYHLDPNLALTGRLGYIQHLKKSVGPMDITSSEIPVLAGVKYYFGEMEGPYLGAELGLFSLRTKMSGEIPAIPGVMPAQSFDESDSVSRFGMTFGGGYEVSNVDLRAQILVPNVLGREDGEDMQMGIMFNVGYRFMEF